MRARFLDRAIALRAGAGAEREIPELLVGELDARHELDAGELLLRESQLSLGILAVQTVFQLSGTALLFLPASNIWFRNHGKSSKLTPP